jgi:hypothetical protein
MSSNSKKISLSNDVGLDPCNEECAEKVRSRRSSRNRKGKFVYEILGSKNLVYRTPGH